MENSNLKIIDTLKKQFSDKNEYYQADSLPKEDELSHTTNTAFYATNPVSSISPTSQKSFRGNIFNKNESVTPLMTDKISIKDFNVSRLSKRVDSPPAAESIGAIEENHISSAPANFNEQTDVMLEVGVPSPAPIAHAASTQNVWSRISTSMKPALKSISRGSQMRRITFRPQLNVNLRPIKFRLNEMPKVMKQQAVLFRSNALSPKFCYDFII